MTPTNEQLTQAIGKEAVRELDNSLGKIKHCLDQLSDDQVWWRPHASMNGVGNLVLHLCGNVQQWLIAGINETPDTRNRPAEFTEGPIPKEELLSKLQGVVDQASRVLTSLAASQITAPRRIQAFERTVLGAIFDSVPHFHGHAQEIICLTRMQLGDSYRYKWVPKTREEGAPA